MSKKSNKRWQEKQKKYKSLINSSVIKPLEIYSEGIFSQSRDGYGFVDPITGKEKNCGYYISPENINGAKTGNLVRCKKIYTRRKTEGKIVAILQERISILDKYSINEAFPAEVLDEKIDTKITSGELLKRLNLTQETVITIDGDDAKDLDDAISIKKDGDNYILGVHIADVTHFVKRKSNTDIEAFERGTSVYFSNTVYPMLPSSLSNGLCSLNPNEIKLTLSVVMTIDKKGDILHCKIKKSYIKSKARMTYSNVKKMLDGEKIPEFEFIRKDLKMFYSLYKILRKRRKKVGFLEFNFAESKFKFDENNKVIDVSPYETSFSNEMIEEFMLCANVAVAEFASHNKLPFVYRIHDQPDPEKIENLYKLLKIFGIPFKPTSNPTPKELDKILQKCQDEDIKPVIYKLTLRAMQKAVYASSINVHYGLNFPKYCHFTSPIRRYPDLIIHRILSEFLAGKDVRKYKNYVEDVSLQASLTERNAMLAEREEADIRKAEYMANKVGETYEGVISGMINTGLFVELQNTIEGFVDLRNIENDKFSYNEELLLMVGAKTTFRMGQAVDIKLTSVNTNLGKIDFDLT